MFSFYARSQFIHSFSLLILLTLLTGCQVRMVPTQAPAATAVGAEMQALPPENFALPDLELDFPVVPMGWSVVEGDAGRTTQWELPLDAIGWQTTSAALGEAGRTILSGHQTQGDAPLKPLALGEIEPGQEVLLTASDGTVFVYQITEVTEPIPLTGATPEEEATAATYVAPTTEPMLTLITGWPDFTTTHRVFAVAEFVETRE